ncbi:HAMP domain-containing histidine kinase [Lentzea sp. PSKA42]|uniref:histidine kinase n=1 Tax=Lentzea indica TaxID=2604800 RepID=A0ABX1FPN0_9PSEU|nr:HAMP domain-containing sensor histidine kinase [Lentzea indica]NKE60959.1 HAMP domain-containing histidine kinase [Lentzea indica]
MSVKLRLALLCGGLFLLGGAILLATNYLLVRTALPDTTGAPPGQSTDADLVAPSPGSAPVVGSSGTDLSQYRQEVLQTLVVQSGVALAVMAVVALALGWFAAVRMLRPVQEVVATAQRLEADSLHERIRMPGPRDELTELADTFDGMLDRLAASFDSQKRFVANASHELRTPLATQRTMIEIAMARRNAGPELRDLCERLLVMNMRTESLIEGLLLLARSDRGLEHEEPVRLDEVARGVVDSRRHVARQAGVRLEAALWPQVVSGDPVLLERLVVNLVDNAITYNHEGGLVTVRTGGESVLEVRNTGPDVPADQVGSLFEPFRQLRKQRTGPGRGVGLGLSIVASIAKAHGGSMRAVPRSGGGLEMAFSVP